MRMRLVRIQEEIDTLNKMNEIMTVVLALGDKILKIYQTPDGRNSKELDMLQKARRKEEDKLIPFKEKLKKLEEYKKTHSDFSDF